MRILTRSAGAGVAIAAAASVIAPRALADDAASGRRLILQQCLVCHTVEAGGPSKVGPNLHGMCGKKAGAAPGFACSTAMSDSDVVWDEESLATYLRHPSGMMKGTKMAFIGVKEPRQLADLIAYLRQATQ